MRAPDARGLSTPAGFVAVLPRLPADDAAASEVLRTLYRAGVVVFPKQEIDPSRLEAVARRIGVLEAVRPKEHRCPGAEHVRLQSNQPGLGVDGGGLYWHADGSWKAEPTAATLLACAAAPEHGGGTIFLDGRQLYRDLGAMQRAWADDSEGFYPSRDILRDELAAMRLDDDELVETNDNVWHPLVRVHPISGERAIILNQGWLRELRGPSGCDARAFLAELYERLGASSVCYEHRWRSGDVLLWDNRLVMHRALPTGEGTLKITWRVTIERIERRIV